MTSGKSIHRRAATVVGLLFILVLSACGSDTKSESLRDLSKITLLLGDQSRFLRAKAEAAKVFEGAPYKIEWINFQGAAPLLEALAAGAVDTAVAGDSPVLFASAAGAPMKIVAGIRFSGRDVAIIVPASSPIKTISDFKSQEVIVSSARGSVSHYQLIGALKENGLTTADIKLGFMLPVDALTAFNAGHIGVWATFGSYLAMAERQGARVIRNGEGIFSGLGLLTVSDKALADPAKRAALADVLVRLVRADEWAMSHPDDYAKVFVSVTGLPLEVARTLITRELGVWSPIDEAMIDSLQEISDVFTQEHILSHPVNARSLFDASLLASKQ